MRQAQERNRKEKEEAERLKALQEQTQLQEQEQHTVAGSEASASTYSCLHRRIQRDEYISPEQVERFLGVRSSRKNAPVRDTCIQTEQDVVKVRKSRRDDTSSTVSKASSIFQRKFSAKIACVACVVGIPKATREEGPDDDAEDETRQEDATTGHDDAVVQQQESWFSFGGAASSLVDGSAMQENPDSRKQTTKRVSFLSDLVESHNQRVDPPSDDDEELENQIAEYSLLSCLDDAERWLGIRDDVSANASITTGGSSRGPFSCS